MGYRVSNCAAAVIDGLGCGWRNQSLQTSGRGRARCTCDRTKVEEHELWPGRHGRQASKKAAFGLHLAFMDGRPLGRPWDYSLGMPCSDQWKRRDIWRLMPGLSQAHLGYSRQTLNKPESFRDTAFTPI